MSLQTIEIRYRRLPDRTRIFKQELVVDRPDLKVTYLESYPGESIVSDERILAEAGAPMIWFVFPGAWYDLGMFFMRDGSQTGYYANIIAPPALSGPSWELTDLFLDVWYGVDGAGLVLDRDEFEEARRRGWLDSATAIAAESALERILAEIAAGDWPPPAVRTYDLDGIRALRATRL